MAQSLPRVRLETLAQLIAQAQDLTPMQRLAHVPALLSAQLDLNRAIVNAIEELQQQQAPPERKRYGG